MDRHLTTIVQLTRGAVARIDEKNSDLADRRLYRWYCSRDGYAMRSLYDGTNNQRKEHLHRKVLERKLGRPMREGTTTEFINGDALDCREDNLREVSWATEVSGRKWQPPSKRETRTGHTNPTGERYVYQRRGGRYQVQVYTGSTIQYVGVYMTLDEAVEARNIALIQKEEIPQ